MTTSNVRYHPYPCFTYTTVPSAPRGLSQRPSNPPSDGYGNQLVPYPPQPFPNQWHGNYPGYFQYNPGNMNYRPGPSHPRNPAYVYPPYMTRGWASYPTFVPGPPPPSIPETVQISNQLALQYDRTETPILSHLFTDLLQSPSIHSVNSAASSDFSGGPLVEPPVIQVDDDDDPIAEAMAAVGLDPGLIDEIKEQAITTSTSYADYQSQSHIDHPSPNVSTTSATSSERLSQGPTKYECLICNRSYENLNLHTFNHMVSVITGFESAGRDLVLWIKENYPVVLLRTVYCQICKLNTGIFTTIDMRRHVGRYHYNYKYLNESGIERIIYCCFPKWSQQELRQFGSTETDECNQMESGTSFCPVCSNFQGQPEEITYIAQHAKHMHQHFRNLIAGNEQPNPNLTAWLKCYDPLSLERNIFCKICQTACRLLTEHANKHGIQDIEYCFPKWNKEQLIRLGFMIPAQCSEKPSRFQSRNLAYQQTTAHNTSHSSSTIFVQETGRSFIQPKSDFDLLDNLESFIGENADDQRSTPSPGRLVIDMPDENYSPALVIEEIVDEDSCGVDKTFDSSFHVDTDNSYGVDKTVDSVDSSLIIDNGYSCSIDNNVSAVDSSFDVYSNNSYAVDKTFDSNFNIEKGNNVVVEQQLASPINQIANSINADTIQSSSTAKENVNLRLRCLLNRPKTADISNDSSIASSEPNSVSSSCSIITVNDTDSTDSAETICPSPGFIPIDPCPTTPVQSPPFISSYGEQSDFNTVVLSPASAWLAVSDPLVVGNEIINLAFMSEADEIESAMAEVSVRKKCCYKYFCQNVKIPYGKPNYQHIVRLENQIDSNCDEFEIEF